MEAARIAALRGHRVTLHEAAPRLGGQVLLAARAGWRRDMLGIADWLAGEIASLGVEVRCDAWIDGPELLDDRPDAIVVATGGVPDTDLPEGGGALGVTAWDLLSGAARPAAEVMVHGETGGHGALSTADWLAAGGAAVEIVTPDRQVGRAIGGQNLPVYLRNLYRAGARLTPDHRLLGLRRDGNGLVATLWNAYARVRVERRAQQVVIDRCTLPADAPLHALRAGARNPGETDVDVLLALAPQPEAANPEGTHMLFRIGDAVAARDIHAAMLDASRLARAL